MVSSKSDILRPFQEGKALKVISGLENFKPDLVEKVSTAARIGGATHIDIACDPELVKIAVEAGHGLPVCVSAVDPKLFPAALEAGASMVELGNFDSFYSSGRTFSAEEVKDLTRETRELVGSDVPLAVTVPHTLELDAQVELAQELEALGADVIQTEGKYTLHPSKGGVQGLIERAAPTLAAAREIARGVSVPVMAASGLSDVTAPMALSVGAKGVGVGSAVNKLNSEIAMIAVVKSIANSMGVSAVKTSMEQGQEFVMST
eukprot:CAMPEP_0113938692 /NCGR_PEP_ID=MMETSP1339-20121228/5111_1 /TAXON_ID=94617 /ORGANISM="Fibrocapsa japonica" /LENGTH=261 /DNA_ID=CAMNT_0000941923 /DNA_START=140 /DNA_END=925 /DNA_ORIENTATION=- /assembly_acc=CAM_ASM_000762